jgi:hypothetical protein
MWKTFSRTTTARLMRKKEQETKAKKILMRYFENTIQNRKKRGFQTWQLKATSAAVTEWKTVAEFAAGTAEQFAEVNFQLGLNFSTDGSKTKN